VIPLGLEQYLECLTDRSFLILFTVCNLFATPIGKAVAGEGAPYDIYNYGTGKLNEN